MDIATPESWYASRRVSDGVTLIWEQHVSPDLRCNIWHVQGRDSDLLVDSGLGLVSLREQVSALSGRPVLAVASHTHFDHIGCHHEFEQRLCHPAEAEVLERPSARNTVWAEYSASQLGTNPLRALPRAGFDLAGYRVEPAPATRLIDEGDEVDLGDRLFRVFHMPGHSPGSLCLYEAATRTLFTGDVLYDGELLDTLYHSDREAYRETLARLTEIPAEVFHCGHFASFGRTRMLELVAAYQASRVRA